MAEVTLSLAVSPELDKKLGEMARASRLTKNDLLLKAIALFDVATEAAQEQKHLGLFDRDRNLVTEIVGL